MLLCGVVVFVFSMFWKFMKSCNAKSIGDESYLEFRENEPSIDAILTYVFSSTDLGANSWNLSGTQV